GLRAHRRSPHQEERLAGQLAAQHRAIIGRYAIFEGAQRRSESSGGGRMRRIPPACGQRLGAESASQSPGGDFRDRHPASDGSREIDSEVRREKFTVQSGEPRSSDRPEPRVTASNVPRGLKSAARNDQSSTNDRQDNSALKEFFMLQKVNIANKL